MKTLNRKIKLGIFLLLTALLLVSIPFILYLKILPQTVSDEKFIDFIQKTAKESLDADLVIKNPILTTNLSPELEFKVDEILVVKDKKTYLSVKNLDSSFSLAKLPQHKIILKKFGSDYVFADINGLMKLSGKQQETPKTDWNVEWLDSRLYLKKGLILYKPRNDINMKINASNLEITSEKNPKRVHFNINVKINKGKETLSFDFADKNNVYIKDKKLFIDNFILNLNGSKIYINSVADENNHFTIKLSSKHFDVKNVIKLLDTNLIIPNGTEILSLFKNIDGNFDFRILIKDKNINGEINVNKGFLKIIPLNNIPVTINEGKITLNEKDIFLKDFKGYYGSNKNNKVTLKGSVKDYTKKVITDVKIKADITNDFTKNYLSPIVNFPLEVVGNSRALIVVNSIYDKIDVKWLYKVKKGDDILIAGSSMSPKNYDRVLTGNLHFEDNILDIKKIDYYIAEVINRQNRPKPILNVKGSLDLSKDILLKDIGFEIPKPLPSEFLNLFIGQKFFKKGTVQGHLKIKNDKKYPVLDGVISFDNVRIPSQRLSIKQGRLITDDNMIHLKAFGRFKKSDYKFNGDIKNELALPVIVKDIDLTVDNIDIERVLKSFNNQPIQPSSLSVTAKNPTAQAVTAQTTAMTSSFMGTADANASAAAPQSSMSRTALEINNDVTDETYTFNPNLLIVEKCMLNVIKGVYKQINFGNLHANLTLDNDGILEVQSNKFDFAEGISTLKVHCDLKNHIYKIRLGTKDVNSDVIATSLLNLSKEISGKASALIELYSDDTLKLNGKIQFIVKDGTITKLGLVEYVLNFAALFRNPIVMISPSTLVDLVNIPEGTFDNIKGVLDIKNNIVEKIDIKSSSPQLSSFIAGRMNLENGDSTLRIYTKFSNKNKGFSGFLRGLSLNSLARRVLFNSKTETNYYEAEISQLPPIDADEKDSQIFLTKVEGDVQTNNFLSSLKKIK